MSSLNPPLLSRLRSLWAPKLCLGAALTVVFCTGYFVIQYYPLRLPIRFGLTIIDRSVPFSPKWVWVYQSVYLLLLAAWLCETTDQLKRYFIGFTFLTVIGFICFLLWPVAGPRPQESSGDPMYNALVRYDTTLNSFPSLHMALAAYSACVAVAVTTGSLRRWLIIFLPLWVTLIGYSTLATKQHYWVDLPPGIALGCLAQYFAWRHSASRLTTPAAEFSDRGAA
jgi:membrane-associated phospholipid phosphatase